MDPLSKFEADRYPDWKTVIQTAPLDIVKIHNALCRLTIPDLHLAVAALEAQRPPVSERSVLSMSERRASYDRLARCVPPQAPTPSPVPLHGRRCRSPSLIRRIRADRLNREKADELASLKEAKARMEMHGKRARPPATGDGQPITPRQALLIDGIEIKGVAWGDESPRARRCGIMSEMRCASMVFGLSHMISSHNGLNAGATMSTLEGVVQGLVDDVNVARFKVGITWNPPHRWANDRYGYEMNYSRMHLLLVDQSPSKCGIYEAFLIRAFQKHAKIDNVKIGDDNRQNVSPHYVYLVTKLVG